MQGYDCGTKSTYAAAVSKKNLTRCMVPFERAYHQVMKKGGVPSIQEGEFSITHNRGCFGACNFCAIAFHQGRELQPSEASVLRKQKH